MHPFTSARDLSARVCLCGGGVGWEGIWFSRMHCEQVRCHKQGQVMCGQRDLLACALLVHFRIARTPGWAMVGG
jgi:hypothetical protein